MHYLLIGSCARLAGFGSATRQWDSGEAVVQMDFTHCLWAPMGMAASSILPAVISHLALEGRRHRGCTYTCYYLACMRRLGIRLHRCRVDAQGKGLQRRLLGRFSSTLRRGGLHWHLFVEAAKTCTASMTAAGFTLQL
mmetsp:Transcript_58610/g.116245  ORF Transcript_58610/g.116245 Transcript_58610/m.116245 type:complete len:138 (+) Transcript_58610:111-524(+)